MSFVNKKFSPEDDEDESDVAPQLPQGTRNYITPGGHARLKLELDFLLRTDRPSVVDAVHWAALNGDRSENGDYIYGKRRLREIDRRIRFLTQRLDKAEIVDPERQDAAADQVFFGASVTICDESGGEQTYQIVGVDETDLARGRISWLSPLARALIKARVGDAVRFQSPLGWREVEIILVEYRAIEARFAD
jgi:transcription elongation factor GreB